MPDRGGMQAVCGEAMPSRSVVAGDKPTAVVGRPAGRVSFLENGADSGGGGSGGSTNDKRMDSGMSLPMRIKSRVVWLNLPSPRFIQPPIRNDRLLPRRDFLVTHGARVRARPCVCACACRL